MKDKNHDCHCSYWRAANHVGLFLVVLFVICFSWYFIRPVEQDLHFRLLKLSFFGYDGMNLMSFILGAIQSYIWGYIFVGICYLTGCSHKHNCHEHHEHKEKK